MKLFSRFLLCLCLAALPFRSTASGPLVQFNIYDGTSLLIGEVDVELYDKDKPITSSNFLYLIRSGAYSNGFFHRCVPGFIIQGGGYSVINTNSASPFSPYSTNLNNLIDPNSITNEYGIGKFYSNTNWTISMAKTSDPNSAASQFFFNLGNNSANLDNTNNSGGFTVFGHTVGGAGVLGFFNSFYGFYYGLVDETRPYGTNVNTIPFSSLPNREFNGGVSTPPFYDLCYYTINILTAKIKLATNGAPQITWLSVYGYTNNLEFTTNLNSSWQVLTNPVGTGDPITITDSDAIGGRRFYRVHPLF